MAYEEALLLLEYARSLDADSRQEEGAAARAEAQAILTQLGARA